MHEKKFIRKKLPCAYRSLISTTFRWVVMVLLQCNKAFSVAEIDNIFCMTKVFDAANMIPIKLIGSELCCG
jgi:hypothetical protein